MSQWNEIFKKEGRVFTKPDRNISKVLKFFKKHNINRILDSGFGSGRHVVYLAKRGFDVYGIDISEEGLRLTESWLEKENLKANLMIGSIFDKLPYSNDFFDAIISVDVLMHAEIEDIRKAIREMERILKPSGLIFLKVRKGHLGQEGLPRQSS